MNEFDFNKWLKSYAERNFPVHKEQYIKLYKQQRKNGMGCSEDERWARLAFAQKHLTTSLT
jgi:hypothetical protein